MRDDVTSVPGPVPPWAGRWRQPRDPRTGYLHPRRCEFYTAGHTVHHIQALRSTGKPHEIGRLVEVDGNLVTIDFHPEIRQYRNHEVERLVEIVGLGGGVRVCEDFVILRGGGEYCFSIAKADREWTPCDAKPLTTFTYESLAERLRTHGGFLVPSELLDSPPVEETP